MTRKQRTKPSRPAKSRSRATPLKLVFQLPEGRELPSDTGKGPNSYRLTLGQAVRERCAALTGVVRPGILLLMGSARFEHDAFPEVLVAEVRLAVGDMVERLVTQADPGTAERHFNSEFGECSIEVAFYPLAGREGLSELTSPRGKVSPREVEESKEPTTSKVPAPEQKRAAESPGPERELAAEESLGEALPARDQGPQFSLGLALREIRELLGLTQAAAAAKLGVAADTWRLVESGHRNLSNPTLNDLPGALGVPMSWILLLSMGDLRGREDRVSKLVTRAQRAVRAELSKAHPESPPE